MIPAPGVLSDSVCQNADGRWISTSSNGENWTGIIPVLQEHLDFERRFSEWHDYKYERLATRFASA